MHEFDADVIIVGGGPAGLSTALHLVQKRRSWAERMLILEKASYPREKLCGGGITLPGLEVLKGLGLALDIPHMDVRKVELRYLQYRYLLQSDPAFVVVHRSEFDHWLAREARSRGVAILEGETVNQVEVTDAGVWVETQAKRYRAKTLVAADGSNSIVRRRLKWGQGQKARLLETLTPADPQSAFFKQGLARFDWSGMQQGLQGYIWDFPSLVNGQWMMNRGIFDSRLFTQRPQKPHLPTMLAQHLARQGVAPNEVNVKGFPIHWWRPGKMLSRPRVLLAGDAAGADPLFGEGIAFALGYGEVAADCLDAAFSAKDFRFEDYAARVREHWLLRQLQARYAGARLAFGSMRWPPLVRAMWRTAPWLFRALVAVRPDYFPLTKKRMYRF